ncbi:MAG: hypothetical protein GY750_02385 [Lentisphaerae bacterium]|nr:hypothetical protein [Lentisphaerota bacterium]MCP4100269.1 hypothetical protein [Lentisphaerota bacterium]
MINFFIINIVIIGTIVSTQYTSKSNGCINTKDNNTSEKITVIKRSTKKKAPLTPALSKKETISFTRPFFIEVNSGKTTYKLSIIPANSKNHSHWPILSFLQPILAFIIIIYFLYFIYQKFKLKDKKLLEGSLRKHFLSLTVLIELLIIVIFFEKISPFIKGNEWLKGILPLFMAAVPGYLIWHWRDENKRKDQEHVEKELSIKENTYLWNFFRKNQKIIEWERNEQNFVISEAQKVSAVFALGEYYKKEGTDFPKQVHEFFKEILNNFWENNEPSKSLFENERILDFLEKYIRESAYEEAEKAQELKVKLKLLDIKLQAPENIEQLLEVKSTLESKIAELSSKLKEIKIPRHIQSIYEVIYKTSFYIYNNNFKIFHNKNLSLSGFKFINTKFEGYTIDSADLSNAYLINVNIQKNTMSKTIYKTNFSNSCLINMFFMKISFKEISFECSKFINIRFYGCKFINCHFNSLSIKNSQLSGVDFSGFFKNKYCETIYIENSRLEGCNFQNRYMNKSVFKNVKYHEVSFENSVLEECNFYLLPLTPNSLLPNDLSFKNSRLSGSNFNNSILRNIDFSNSELYAVSFLNSQLTECNFADSYYAQKVDKINSVFAERQFKSLSNIICIDKMIDLKDINIQKLNLKEERTFDPLNGKKYLLCPGNTTFSNEFSIPKEKMNEFYTHILSILK